MHFIDGGHRDGVLEHYQPPGIQSDLLRCDPDESRTVVCPIALGVGHVPPQQDAAHDHRQPARHVAAGPHPAPAVVGTGDEGDHYPWKIYVDQISGRRIKPSTR